MRVNGVLAPHTPRTRASGAGADNEPPPTPAAATAGRRSPPASPASTLRSSPNERAEASKLEYAGTVQAAERPPPAAAPSLRLPGPRGAPRRGRHTFCQHSLSNDQSTANGPITGTSAQRARREARASGCRGRALRRRAEQRTRPEGCSVVSGWSTHEHTECQSMPSRARPTRSSCPRTVDLPRSFSALRIASSTSGAATCGCSKPGPDLADILADAADAG
jgi:hypothetical protein